MLAALALRGGGLGNTELKGIGSRYKALIVTILG